MRRIIILALIILSYTLENKAQSNAVYLKCLLTNSQTKKPVAYVQIYNESQRFGAISDSSGTFTIKAVPGDTLVFIALGYLGDFYTIQKKDFDTILSFQLLPRSYEIEEVSIEFPGTYKHFKQALLELEPNKDRPIPELPQHNKYKIPEVLDTNVIYNLGYTIMHPVFGLYYRFSKEEKSKRKVWYAKQQELKQPEVNEKFNREIVHSITGLDADELTNFIGYCNFSFNFLLETSSYEILHLIEIKFQEYQVCCITKE